jgi:phosphatidate cytidylyltransferase
MTHSSPAHRSGARDPGTEPLPRVAARVAEPATAEPVTAEVPAVPADSAWPGGDDADTGPLPAVVDSPASTGPSSRVRPAAEPVAIPPVAGSRVAATTDDVAPGDGHPPGRAGRNLTAAIGVGLGLGAVILASLLVYRPAFLVVLGVTVLLGIVELTRALRAGGFAPPLIPVLVGAVAMVALAWTRGAEGLAIAFLFTVLAVVLWRLGDGPVGYLRDTSSGVLVALYVPLLAGFAVLLLVPFDGAARVLIFIATVVCNDVGGYAAGVLVGRHPMAPSISPKKSWEGLGGSVLACMLVATPVIWLTFHGPWWGGLVFGAAIAASATVGDLAESLIKRDLEIKDMGHLLPGHGGIMDRLDSLLPSAAVAYLLLSVLVPV